VGNWTIMFRHVLPNAMVATLTFLPFIVTGTIGSLASLDFLGFGLPSSAPSLGEMTLQAKNNLNAPWLGFTAFFTFAIMLSLLVFVFEGVRDAFDPRKTFAGAAPPDFGCQRRYRTGGGGAEVRPILDVRNLTVRFGSTEAVSGVTFTVGKGETVALVGESGSGKSVTALSTVSLLPETAELRGSITYDGAEMLGASEADLRGSGATTSASSSRSR
jgi:ABC-type multidrug transport system fused ATPase/permease subunit